MFARSFVQLAKKAAAPKKVKKVKAPAAAGKKPKRVNAYFLFLKEVRADVVAKNPKFSITDVGREIGARWRALPEADRQKYISTAAAARK
jgi:uncharacterized protein (DUF736 family)